ncbi:MAG: ABC transporter ATP-binding protein [Trueperaceae bacterium]|nr:ABC transporter ATP-binding protein [Trueperaceae bacterium]
MSRGIRFERVSVAFARGAPFVLDAVDLAVQPGEVVGLVGPNGAGKSTLLRVATRLVEPHSGTCTVDGSPVSTLSQRALARSVAFVAQAPEVPVGFRVREVVAMGRAPHLGLFGTPGAADEAAVTRALEATETEAFADRFVETLSGGELQRVVFARALAQEPKYLLLDEPTNHLDLRFQVGLLRQARAQAEAGLGVLLVVHDLNLAARACDRLVLLEAGRVVAQGRPSEVLRAETLSGVFRADVEVLDGPDGPVVVARVEVLARRGRTD